MSEHPLYRLTNVTKEYEGRAVLRVDRLSIRESEIVGLVGPSGAGKSTLLRLLNFLESATAGRIVFDGVDYDKGRAVPLDVVRQITTVFQRPILLNTSVAANVAFGLNVRGRRDADDEIHAALEQVGLADKARQLARTLSGGEAQRVALARAMVLRPRVLLLDEPTANLDPYNVGLIEDIVIKLNETTKATLVVVTHNVFQARRLAHRVGLLLDGQLVEVSNVNTFFEAPKDPRTAAFVEGRMVY